MRNTRQQQSEITRAVSVGDPRTAWRRLAGAPIPGVSFHAQERAAERIGRDLTRAEWLGVVASIIDGRAALLARHEDMTELYLVACGPVAIQVVWRPLDGIVATVRPDGSAPGRGGV